MNGKLENFSRELKSIQKNHTDILGLENAMREL